MTGDNLAFWVFVFGWAGAVGVILIGSGVVDWLTHRRDKTK